jgi:hypothetical protein
MVYPDENFLLDYIYDGIVQIFTDSILEVGNNYFSSL